MGSTNSRRHGVVNVTSCERADGVEVEMTRGVVRALPAELRKRTLSSHLNMTPLTSTGATRVTLESHYGNVVPFTVTDPGQPVGVRLGRIWF